jgi:hypothetical protein
VECERRSILPGEGAPLGSTDAANWVPDTPLLAGDCTRRAAECLRSREGGVGCRVDRDVLPELVALLALASERAESAGPLT